MITIKKITALEILDSRGNPTIEATVELSDGNCETASIPSGGSIGKYEAYELRDNDESRYGGKGMLKAVNNINNLIGPKLVGEDVVKQGKIDQLMLEMDGTENKEKLGANSILVISLAVCRAAAKALKLPLYMYIAELLNTRLPSTISKMPTPTFNVINGGKHGTGNLDIQEFHVIPSTIQPYNEALRLGDEIYQQIKKVLVQRNANRSVGDEGGFTPNLYTNIDALDIIMEAIKATKYKFGIDVFLGLDIAASHLQKENSYVVKDKATAMSTEEFIAFLENLHHDYRLLMLEDPLAEDDWAGWQLITQKLGREVHIVGDDLLVTNPERLKKAIADKACTSILIKPNQIGSLSETLQVIKIAKQSDFKIIVSHRSGETTDPFIADLAVGVNAEYVKFGAPARGERVVKYNRLIRIQQELKL